MNFGLLKDLLTRETPSALLGMVFHNPNLLPEVYRLDNVEENPKHHPEGNTGIHMNLVMNRVFELTTEPKIRLAALLHDVGKAVTGGTAPNPETGETSTLGGGKHHKHDSLGVAIVNNMFSKYIWPHSWKGLAAEVAEFHIRGHMLIDDNKPADRKVWIKFIDDLKDSWVHRGVPESQFRNELESFCTACQADVQGRLGMKETPYHQKEILLNVFQMIQEFEKPENKEKREDTYFKRDQIRKELLKEYTEKLTVINPDVHENEIQKTVSEVLRNDYPELITDDLATQVGKYLKNISFQSTSEISMK